MIGVLALQGDFELHERKLEELGASWMHVKTEHDLRKVAGLIIPGGESSVLLKLSSDSLRETLRSRVNDGLAVLATCAGLIFLAERVADPLQESLGLLHVDVRRNAYGRQIDSFIEPNLTWTTKGQLAIKSRLPDRADNILNDPLEGVFIRAPRISRCSSSTEVLIERHFEGSSEPVMIREGKILGASFHPELSPNVRAVHELFLALAYSA